MAYGKLIADEVQSSTANTPVVFKDGNGTQVGTLCRAWVNFNGTGTVAIRASFNVSSITDSGTGDYIVNFTNAMPDANYAVLSASGGGTTTNPASLPYSSRTTNSVIVKAFQGANSAFDQAECSVSIFR